MGKRVNWDHWKEVFVTGDDSVTFAFIAEMDGAPAYSSIKNKACPPKNSSEASWSDLRKQYRKELAKESVGGEKVKLSVEQAVERTQKIIDTAEMLIQHNAIAKGLLSLASQGIRARVEAEAGKDLKPMELIQMAKVGIEIQRIIEGMATSKTEIDFKGMSDTELDEIINGNA